MSIQAASTTAGQRRKGATDVLAPPTAANTAARPKILLVATGKGGSSKTTLASSFAAAAAAEGRKVAVIDTDRQQTFSRWLSRRSVGLPVIAAMAASLFKAAEVVRDLTGYDLIII